MVKRSDSHTDPAVEPSYNLSNYVWSSIVDPTLTL